MMHTYLQCQENIGKSEFYTANNCSESAVEWLQFHFSYSDPLHTVSHCTPLQWINVTIAVEATCHDLGWKDFENCVLKML